MVLISRRIAIASFFGSCLGIGFVVKDRIGGKKYTYQTDAAKGKVIIITGATSGIGEALAKELAFRKAHLILACKDLKACEKMKVRLMYFNKIKNIDCIECDLASQESIRKFVHAFDIKYKKLDVLVNNAGVFGIDLPRKTTAEGIEMHLGVNHIGPFLLTNLLLPKLQKSAPSRVLNVTSLDYKKAKLNKDDLNLIQDYDAKIAYSRSKLANVLFTVELSKRLRGTGVTVNAVYPGVVETKLMRHSSFYKSWLSSIFLKPFIWIFIKNPKQGSQPILYAAIDPNIENITGCLFGHNFTMETLEPLEDDAIDSSKWLWNVSDKWCGYPSLSTFQR